MAPKPCVMKIRAGKSVCMRQVQSGKGGMIKAGKGEAMQQVKSPKGSTVKAGKAEGMKIVRSGQGQRTGAVKGALKVTGEALKKPAALKPGTAAFKAAEQKIAAKAEAAAERLRRKGIALILSGAFWR